MLNAVRNRVLELDDRRHLKTDRNILDSTWEEVLDYYGDYLDAIGPVNTWSGGIVNENFRKKYAAGRNEQ